MNIPFAADLIAKLDACLSQIFNLMATYFNDFPVKKHKRLYSFAYPVTFKEKLKNLSTCIKRGYRNYLIVRVLLSVNSAVLFLFLPPERLHVDKFTFAMISHRGYHYFRQ